MAMKPPFGSVADATLTDVPPVVWSSNVTDADDCIAIAVLLSARADPVTAAPARNRRREVEFESPGWVVSSERSGTVMITDDSYFRM
ncbi:hypothetical protein HAL_27470 [Haladaptatus sp. T7]|nr:hypothetical protein HAL_27470 [Haladaptatus sp. T7]